MHFKTIIVFSLLLTLPASAQDEPRWRTDFGKGSYIAAIMNPGEARFEISCPVGHGKPIRIYFHSPVYARVEGEKPLVSVILNDEVIRMEMVDDAFVASDPEGIETITKILDLLAGAKAKTFHVATKGKKLVERFSLAGAKEELATGKTDGVRTCLTPDYLQNMPELAE